MITTTCPTCSSTDTVEDAAVGKSVKCKNCDSIFRVLKPTTNDIKSSKQIQLAKKTSPEKVVSFSWKSLLRIVVLVLKYLSWGVYIWFLWRLGTLYEDALKANDRNAAWSTSIGVYHLFYLFYYSMIMFLTEYLLWRNKYLTS